MGEYDSGVIGRCGECDRLVNLFVNDRCPYCGNTDLRKY